MIVIVEEVEVVTVGVDVVVFVEVQPARSVINATVRARSGFLVIFRKS